MSNSLSKRDSLSASLITLQVISKFCPRRKVNPVASIYHGQLSKSRDHGAYKCQYLPVHRGNCQRGFRASGVPGGEGDNHGIVFPRQLCASSNQTFGSSGMKIKHNDVVVATIHTTHALQNNIVGINYRHVKPEKFIHRVMRHRGGRT